MKKIDFDKFDAVVAGSGFAGATAAERYASIGKKVLVLEKRSGTGGNMREGRIGGKSARVHLYGPHIFHTDDKTVFDYLSRFTNWMPYEHRVLAAVQGKLIPVPFNFTSLEAFFPSEKAERMKRALRPLGEAVTVFELKKRNDELNELGEFVFENIFLHYTEKQWGTTIDKVDTGVINRVPVRIGYDDRYFSSRYQAMPKDGYNAIFEKMLSSPNITVLTGVEFNDYFSFEDKVYAGADRQVYHGKIIYTGEADKLLNCVYGALPYRTTRMEFENYGIENFQSAAVVNYPNEHDFTRITEFKYLTGEKLPYTTVLREYPKPYEPQKGDEPFYPVINAESQELYGKYLNRLKSYPQLVLLGRLAEFKYYDMDKCVKRALGLEL